MIYHRILGMIRTGQTGTPCATSGPDRRARRRDHRRPDDSGMTLVEVLIASTLALVLLTCVFTTMDMLNRVSNSVNAQYQEFDQGVLALAPLQTLLRAEVEPGPAQSGIPQPGFSSVGNFSLTFYSNIGTAYGNVTSAGTTGGPAKLVAQELDANGNPVTSASVCTTSSLCSFTVTEYLPVITNGVSTCPGVSPSGTACQYPTNGKLIVNVAGVVNNPSAGSAAPPIFTYNVFDLSSTVGSNLSYATVQAGLTCTGATASTCPADNIQSVGVELQVGRKGAGTSSTNGILDEQIIVYRYAGSPGASTYPFQYSSNVG
jgi:hypothetical protein